MESDCIIFTAYKIKNLRRKYNVKQEDLAGQQITRNLISQIENGKANLTRSAAEIMLRNLKKICDKKHITIDEDIEYLMEDENSQASRLLDKYIRELKDLSIYKDTSFINKLAEVEKFLVIWNFTDKKIRIFELAGDYFVSINNYSKSSLYYEKAKALMDIHSKGSISVLRKLSMVYFYMGQYDQNIKCCESALYWFTDMSEEYKCIFLFNSALCYMQIKEYDKAIRNFTKLEPIVRNFDRDKYYEVLIQKAICFQCLKSYEKSFDIYNKILENLNDNDIKQHTFVWVKMCYVYKKLLDKDKVKEKLKLVIKTLPSLDKNLSELPNLYFEVGNLFRWLKDLKKAEEYCLTSLSLAKRNSDSHLIEDVILELIDIYYAAGDMAKVWAMKNEFFMLCGKENKINTKVMFKLMDVYIKENDIQAIAQVHNFSSNLLNKECDTCVP